MRVSYTTLLLPALLILAGCSDEHLLERKEDKLIGTWEFEKAFYNSDRAIFRDNITDAYKDDLMIFYGDYSADYVDYSLNSVFPGDWRILLDNDVYFTEEGTTGGVEFFIDAVFDDALFGEDFAFFGSIERLNKDKLNFEARDRDGTYTFKLCRRF